MKDWTTPLEPRGKVPTEVGDSIGEKCTYIDREKHIFFFREPTNEEDTIFGALSLPVKGNIELVGHELCSQIGRFLLAIDEIDATYEVQRQVGYREASDAEFSRLIANSVSTDSAYPPQIAIVEGPYLVLLDQLPDRKLSDQYKCEVRLIPRSKYSEVIIYLWDILYALGENYPNAISESRKIFDIGFNSSHYAQIFRNPVLNEDEIREDNVEGPKNFSFLKSAWKQLSFAERIEAREVFKRADLEDYRNLIFGNNGVSIGGFKTWLKAVYEHQQNNSIAESEIPLYVEAAQETAKALGVRFKAMKDGEYVYCTFTHGKNNGVRVFRLKHNGSDFYKQPKFPRLTVG